MLELVFGTRRRILVAIALLVSIVTLIIILETYYTDEYESSLQTHLHSADHFNGAQSPQFENSNSAPTEKPQSASGSNNNNNKLNHNNNNTTNTRTTDSTLAPIQQFKIDQSAAAQRCLPDETSTIQAACVRCNTFEMKLAFCQVNGYYDRLKCDKSKRIVYRVCSNPVTAGSKFDIFGFTNAALFIVFAGLVKWRQAIMDRKAYARVQAQMGEV